MKKWQNFIDEVKKKHKTIASVICVNENNEILLIKRSKTDPSKPGYWDLPGGHVDDEDKSIELGAIRELREETTLEVDEKDLIYVVKQEREGASKYIYATTIWSGSVNFVENPKSGIVEHSDSRWVTIDQIKDDESLELRTFPAYLLDEALEKLNNDQDS